MSGTDQHPESFQDKIFEYIEKTSKIKNPCSLFIIFHYNYLICNKYDQMNILERNFVKYKEKSTVKKIKHKNKN